MNYDFIAIGDITIDAFIRLSEAKVHCKINREDCEICMRFADKIPYEDVFVVPGVGNSANAAVSATKLGLKSALVANIGDDFFGKQCVQALKKAKVSTEYIATHEKTKTNYHYVLWYEDDRTILVKHRSYPYSLPAMVNPRWVYLSSLGKDSEEFHKMIEQYLMQNPEVKLAFQPGTYQMKMGVEKLKNIYQRTEVFIVNKEEAERILQVAENNSPKSNIQNLLLGLHNLGPRIVVITDGPAGAYASDGKQAWFMKTYPDPKPPYERTGAGDAFSSTFVAALALGNSIEDALRWAPINAMSVVQQVGAQAGLLTKEKILEYLKTAPVDYKPQPI